jgi:hypothetical protein
VSTKAVEATAAQAAVARFYAAFARLEPVAMAALYAEGVRFRDEAFALDGRAATMAMWTMLCEGVRGQGAAGMQAWKLEASAIRTDAADPRVVHAHWDVNYRFGATGRLVLNRIDARFVFDDQGRVVEHVDRFDFWRWSRQALGAPGVLLGWSPWLKAQVAARAAAQLARWQQKQSPAGRA